MLELGVPEGPPQHGPPGAHLLATGPNTDSKASEGSGATSGHWTVKTEILRRGGAPGPRPTSPSWGVGLGARAGAGAGAAAGRAGAAAAPAGRTELAVGGGHGHPTGASAGAHGPPPTWSGSGNRSASTSAIWTWSTSPMTWTTSSWSGRKSAPGFWICSGTVRGRCRERPGERQAPNFPEDPRRVGLGADLPGPLKRTRLPARG